MTTGSDELHVLLGAYVLGGLSDDDHRAFTEHLRTCADCQAELGQVSGLPRLLDLAGPAGGPHLSPDPASELGALGRRRRARRDAARPGRPSTPQPAPLARRRGGRGGRGRLFGAGMWLGPRLTGSPGPADDPRRGGRARARSPSGSTSPS